MSENAAGNASNGQQGQVPRQGQPDQAPQGEATQPSQATGEQGYAPSDPRFAEGQNFKQDPEWRRAQSGYQKQINELTSQLNSIQAESEAQKMSGMSDLQKAEYAAEQWRKQALEQAQSVQDIQSQMARDRDLSDIYQMTGVAPQEVMQHLEEIGSTSAHDAWLFAQQKARQTPNQFTQQQQGAQDVQPPQQQFGMAQPSTPTWAGNQPPPVNTGGGPAPDAKSQYQKAYDEAREKYNMGEMLGVMQQADQAGIEIQEW